MATIDVASGKVTKESGKLDDPITVLDLSPDAAVDSQRDATGG